MQDWTPSEYIAAGSVVVAILSLVVAILTLVLSHLARRHARSESYRAALYSAELSLVADVMRAMAEAHLAAKRLVLATDQDREEKLNAFDAALRAVGVTRDAGVTIMREKVLEAIETDLKALFSAVFPPGDGPQPPADRRPEIEGAWIQLSVALRNELDVDTLGGQVRELTGVANREREAAEQRARLRYLDAQVEVITRGRVKAPTIGDEGDPRAEESGSGQPSS